MRTNVDTSKAMQEWIAALGDTGVATSPSEISRVETTTFATSQKVTAILRPVTTADVQECLRIANRWSVPVYPTSTGKNWGLGSRVPVEDDNVVLDLGRMDKITGYDATFGTLTVQPGVTFEQAWKFLEEKESPFHLSFIGGSKRASVLGNLMERGHGLGPLADRAAHACDFEIVLPQGELVHSGFRRLQSAKLHGLHRWGVGPHIDGLFLQSNLGVVTEVTIWMKPKPKHAERIFARVDEATLPRLVDAIQPLKWDEAIEVILSNKVGLWGFGLSEEESSVPGWCAVINVFTDSPEELTAKVDRTFAALEGIVTVGFIREDDFAERPPADSGIEYVAREAKGGRRTAKPEVDLDDERCGLLWSCPTLPFRGSDVASFTRLLNELFERHRFDFSVTLRPIQARSIDVVLLFTFDRDVPGLDERAMTCHRDVNRMMLEAGYPPYRLGIQSMADDLGSEDGYPSFIQALKKTLDPNDILAPGRYDSRYHAGR